MKSPPNWEFFKQDDDKILWAHICTKDLTGIAISLKNGGRQDIQNIK